MILNMTNEELKNSSFVMFKGKFIRYNEFVTISNIITVSDIMKLW